MAATALAVEHLLDLPLDVTIPSMIPGGPAGTRVTVQVTGGTFAGPRLNGTVIGPSADWAVFRADGSVKLAVLLLQGCDLNEAMSLLHRTGGCHRALLSPRWPTVTSSVFNSPPRIT